MATRIHFADSFTYSPWLLLSVETETIWFAKSEIFTIWPFTEKDCHPWPRLNHYLYQPPSQLCFVNLMTGTKPESL